MTNRVEREVEEILAKLGDLPSEPVPIRARRATTSRLRRFREKLSSFRLFNPGTLMLAGIGLILFSIVLRFISPELTKWTVIIGLTLFVLSFILSFFYRGSGVRGDETYWRGQRFSRSDLSGPSAWERLQSWWRQRRR